MRTLAAGYADHMLSLPNAVVVGAMKCGTTALHHYLAAHPEISMSRVKETNFFIGPPLATGADPEEEWRTGHWHRGVEWYASLFDPSAKVRGETSPGYTSPDHSYVAARMAEVLPDARLVYLVRDPLARAVSQYRHHARDRTERRPLDVALLDPDSQYVARSRYHERIQPFLAYYPLEQVHVVVQERMLRDRRRQLSTVYRHVGADPDWWDGSLARRHHVGEETPDVPAELAAAFRACVDDDVQKLSALLGDELPEWTR